jgi:MoxR-like ATPase
MNISSVREMNMHVKEEAIFIQDLLAEINKVMVGQEALVERVLIALLADGHVLLEGVPGLAKTLLIQTVSETINAGFSRIQFTPDLLPADLIGTQIYSPQTGDFRVHQGPIFSNLVLADEINRAPAKVQSALLEAMQERQITIGDKSFKLDDLFLVLATQNPIEQEGTYPLPEAQVDRFMLKVKVDYPSRSEERLIVDRMTGAILPTVHPIISTDEILHARKIVRGIYVDEKIKEYVIDLVIATRQPAQSGLPELANLIEFGASPHRKTSSRLHQMYSGIGLLRTTKLKRKISPATTSFKGY